MLEIRNLHARIAEDGTEIIRLNLTEGGEVAAIMGPNGSGKSTLPISSRPRGLRGYRRRYPLQRRKHSRAGRSRAAAKGIFLAFQYPVEIPGVATMQFLKVAMNEQRKYRGEEELKTPDFMRRVKEAAPSSKSTRTC